MIVHFSVRVHPGGLRAFFCVSVLGDGQKETTAQFLGQHLPDTMAVFLQINSCLYLMFLPFISQLTIVTISPFYVTGLFL